MRYISFLCFFLFSQLLVTAQSEQALIINIDGQIYRWSPGDAEPVFSGCDLQGQRLHNWDSSLVTSSNGLWVTFMTLEEGAEPTAPSDTGSPWICNITTGESFPLSIIQETRMASKAVFSPDGNQIIWTEVADSFINPSMARLMRHDLGSQETSVLLESLALAVYCGVTTGAPAVIWGEQGIVIPYALTETSDPCSPVTEEGFAHYAADGTLLNRFPVENTFFDTFLWLSGEENRLAYYGYRNESFETQLYSIDMDTGEIREEDAVIEAFMPFEGSGVYHITELEYGYSPPMIYPPSNAPALETQADVALSPDGNLMAIVLGHSLYFAENGQMYPASWNALYYEPYALAATSSDIDAHEYSLDGQVEIAWAVPQYRLVPRPDSVCPALEDQNLSFTAMVVEGLGDNNLRSAPYRASELLGSIPELTVVSIFPNFSPYALVPNPVCSEGIRWQEIMVDGLVAWTAEAEGDRYYLQEN
jgi:hypothetical protein